MAIAVGSTSTPTVWGNRTNTTITAPSGIANGDLLVALLHTGGNGSTPATVTPPSGFTEVTNSPSWAYKALDDYAIAAHVYTKVAASEAGSYVFTHVALDTEGMIYRLTGADTTTPIDVTPVKQSCVTGADGSVTTYPTITTATNGAFLIYAEATWDDVAGTGNPSGTTPSIVERHEGGVQWVGDGTLAIAGATGARTRTNGNTNNTGSIFSPWASIVVPIRPAGALSENPPVPDVWDFVAVGTSVESVATGHTLTEPAGAAQGDLLVAVISSRIASTTSITLPSAEWSLVTEQKANNVLTTTSAVASGMMAQCLRGASPPSYVFTHPVAPSVALGRVVAYRGVHGGKPRNTQNSATTAINTTAINVAGVTTTEPNVLLVVAVCGGQEATLSAFDAATDPTTSSGTGADQTADPIVGTWQERCQQVTTTGAGHQSDDRRCSEGHGWRDRQHHGDGVAGRKSCRADRRIQSDRAREPAAAGVALGH